jgi:hypothetical protein
MQRDILLITTAIVLISVLICCCDFLQDDKAHSKGEGLGFMFCCFSKPATKEPERYGYEMEPTESNTN